MKIKVKDNRDIVIINSFNTQNENDANIISVEVPEQYADFSKKIVFITDDGVVWDLITDNTYALTRAITQYGQVKFYIWLTKNDIDFRTKEETLTFNTNHNVSGEVTPEEQSDMERVLEILGEEVDEVTALVEDIEGKLARGEFNGEKGDKGDKRR